MASLPRLILAAATCLLVLSACREPASPVAATPPVAAPEGRILVAAAHTDPGQLEGAQTIRSVLDVPERMTFGDFAWDERGVASGPVWIRVDLARQLISVFRGADEIGT